MATEQLKKYNFYRRYKWTAEDFSVLQDSLMLSPQNLAEGLAGAAILSGYTIFVDDTFQVNAGSGIASTASGYLCVNNFSTAITIDAATGANAAHIRKDLIVVRPLVSTDAEIANPSVANETVVLRQTRDAEVVVVKGTQGTSAAYPSKLQDDVILCGVSVVPGQTGITNYDVDFSVREVLGVNSNLLVNTQKEDQRFKPSRTSATTISIKPSQLKDNKVRAFSYGLTNRPSIFPKTGGGLYNHADTVLNFSDGKITGGDQVSPDFTPVVPASGQAVVACVSLTSNDELVVSFGTQGTRVQCFDGIYNQKTSGVGAVVIEDNTKPICFVVITSSNGTSIKDVEVVDARSAGGGGGGGAVGDMVVDTFSGNGSQTVFTLSQPPGKEENTQVYISGVYQQKSAYTIASNNITFLVAPPSGTNNIEVVTGVTIPLNTPGINTVYTDALQDGSVTNTKLETAVSLSLSPTGAVQMFAGSSAPTGWLLCDGTEYLKSAYPSLNTVLSMGGTYPYGQTNGSGGAGTTHFRVPDCRGVFVRGVGSQTIGGETFTGALGTKQADATAVNGLATSTAGAHTHNNTGTGTNNFGWFSSSDASGGSERGSVGPGSIASAGGHTHPLTGDTETRPANIAMNYIIKT